MYNDTNLIKEKTKTMSASQITATLKAWNSKQELRQTMLDRKLVNTDYRSVLKQALAKSMCCELQNTKLWSAAMLFNN